MTNLLGRTSDMDAVLTMEFMFLWSLAFTVCVSWFMIGAYEFERKGKGTAEDFMKSPLAIRLYIAFGCISIPMIIVAISSVS